MGSGRQRKGAASDMDAPDRPMKAISASQIIQQYPRRTRLAHACQALCIVIILFFAMSQFITETWTWGMENRYTNWHYWLPYKKVTLSIDQLKEYDGSDLSRPIYIAINGRIYDVTSGADHYGPGGPYHFFAGRDAARAWGTNCLNYPPHYTYDLRGLTDQQLSAIEGWQEFYDNHHTYFYAGKLIHRPIEPDSPLPPDCQNAVPKPGQ